MLLIRRLLLFCTSRLLLLCGNGFGTGLYLSLPRMANSIGQGAVVTFGHECASIGRLILKNKGSAVDAAIAAMFCEGIAMPQSMGLGGGFIMTIYIKKSRTVTVLDARETAPINSHKDMYGGNASLLEEGGLSVAVPGELKGYWTAHQKYGKLPWEYLVKPSIYLCRRGHLVTHYLAGMLKDQEEVLLKSPTLRKVFIDPRTNQTYKEGERIKRLKLAKTLELISQKGAAALYDGQLTKGFIDDINDHNGIITAEDMKTYEPKWKEPIRAKLNDKVMYTSPLPGSGVILTFIMNILNTFLSGKKMDTLQNWQRIIESFKFAYGRRTELGDSDFVPNMDAVVKNFTSKDYAMAIRDQILDDRTFNDPEHYGANLSNVEDHGTSHISVLSPNGDAVSVTSTINNHFGARFLSPSTGIILNDEMDDFSVQDIISTWSIPPSPANYIEPKKRPLSSMCPTIVVDEDGNVSLVIGAAGGTKITTVVAQLLIRVLWFDVPLSLAMSARRAHHQLFPMSISRESGFNQWILDGLRKIGHNISEPIPEDQFAAATAILNLNGKIEASFDPRRKGSALIFS